MKIFDHISKEALIGIIATLTLGAVLFFYLLSDSSVPSPITEVGLSPVEEKLGRELLLVLAKLKATKFDTTVFSDPVFKSLRDFGVEIAPQPVGRRNPFAVFEEKRERTLQKNTATSSKPYLPRGAAGAGAAGGRRSLVDEEKDDFAF